MSDLNSTHNRAVWVDVPVSDLARASRFYERVLALKVHRQAMGALEFAVLDHDQGNGGCLVVKPGEVGTDRGLLVYWNVDGRIRDAVAGATEAGGRVVEPLRSIGPHGFRAVVIDSEGNRIALHSSSDR